MKTQLTLGEKMLLVLTQFVTMGTLMWTRSKK